jgi:hypothetical protein
MSTFVDVCDYASSPRSTDPVELLAEAEIRTAFLKQLLAERDTEIERLQAETNNLYRELAGLA